MCVCVCLCMYACSPLVPSPFLFLRHGYRSFMTTVGEQMFAKPVMLSSALYCFFGCPPPQISPGVTLCVMAAECFGGERVHCPLVG